MLEVNSSIGGSGGMTGNLNNSQPLERHHRLAKVVYTHNLSNRLYYQRRPTFPRIDLPAYSQVKLIPTIQKILATYPH